MELMSPGALPTSTVRTLYNEKTLPSETLVKSGQVGYFGCGVLISAVFSSIFCSVGVRVETGARGV